MKKYTRHLILVAFLVSAYHVSAQGKKYSPKHEQAIKAQEIEDDVKLFIESNLNKYDLTAEKREEVRKAVYRAGRENLSSEKAYEELLAGTTKAELRELYFSQNPDMEHLMRLPIEIRYLCENGGLEEGNADDYQVTTGYITGLVNDCVVNNTLSPSAFSSTINDFSAVATLVDTDVSVSGGFEPILHGLTPPIDLPRVNSGDMAVKLNNTGRGAVTTMSRVFTVNSGIVKYSYFFIAEDSSDPSNRPHFIVTLYDNLTNAVITQDCLEADISNTLMFSSASAGSDTLLYTGWDCAIMSLDGADYGSDVRIEFTVEGGADGLSFGTAYIDDICTDGDCSPRIGKLLLDVNKVKCDPLPITVCGIYSLPTSSNTVPVLYGTVDDLILNIYEGDGVTMVNSIPQSSGTPVITQIDDANYEFCYTIQSSDLGTPLQDDYEFEVVATYTALGYTNTQSDSSAVSGPDLDFSMCCDAIDSLAITVDVLTGNDNQQADYFITASNTIFSGATAIYHAGTEVLLQDDFEALQESTGHYYIQGCTDEFVERPAAPTATAGVNTIDLIENGLYSYSKLAIYPNPAINELNVTAESDIKSLTMFSLDGKIILSNTVNANSYNVDTTAIAKGIYILSVELNNGEVTSHKIVRE